MVLQIILHDYHFIINDMLWLENTIIRQVQKWFMDTISVVIHHQFIYKLEAGWLIEHF